MLGPSELCSHCCQMILTPGVDRATAYARLRKSCPEGGGQEKADVLKGSSSHLLTW